MLHYYEIKNENSTGRYRYRRQYLTAEMAAEIAARPGYAVTKL